MAQNGGERHHQFAECPLHLVVHGFPSPLHKKIALYLAIKSDFPRRPALFGLFIDDLVQGSNEAINFYAVGHGSLLDIFKTRRCTAQAAHTMLHKDRHCLGIFANNFGNAHVFGNGSHKFHPPL